MKSVLIAASMIAMASPAWAQSTGPTPSSPPASTPMPQSSAPAQDSAAPAATPASDPKAIIASEFPTYDKDANGALSRVEFDTWLTALKEKSGDTTMKPADKTAWLKTAFTTADKDKSKGVSLAELTDYLTAAG
jgi:hypothetical protein